MKNLLIGTLLSFACLPAYAQINCANIKASAHPLAGLYPQLLQITYLNQTPKIVTSKVSQTYIIDWGDNTSNTFTQWFGSIGRYYASFGTYIIKMKYIVHDSVFNITCVDSTYDTVVINGPYCNRLKASIAVSITGNGTATLVNNCAPDEPGFSVASYYYNWGDNSSGSTSGKGNLTHNYTQSGTYKVRMIFTLSNPYKVCKDTTDTTISVTVIPPNEISGTVKADFSLTGPNDTIKLLLIKYDSTGKVLKPVDSLLIAPIVNYHSFKFKNHPAGSYRLKAAIIGQPSSTGNIPTYFDSDLMWDKASIITHTGGSTTGAYLPMKTGKVTTGPGMIAGKVRNSYTSRGISGMNVLLLESSGLPVAYDVTDGSGDYSFNNLPIGTYYVHPEDLNYITTTASVVISNSNTSQTSIAFERIAGNKTIVLLGTGISGVNNRDVQFAVYPNPAKNAVNISWTEASDDTADIIITDISGKRVISKTAQMTSVATIALDKLQPGLYFITVTTENGRATLKLIIQ